ncbi:MAG: saccharopine dehydrogenase family protein [Candidatus Heimdallarchaeota archaeon]
MRILVLGIGKIGTTLLKELTRSEEVSELVAADRNVKWVQQVIKELGSDKIQAEQIDAENHVQLVNLMRKDFDVVASALLREHQVGATASAIEAGVPFTDIGNPSQVFELDEAAKDAGVTVIPSFGFDVGIDLFCKGKGVSQLDNVKSIHMYAGGFPQKNTPAYNNLLRYKVSWAWFRAMKSYLGKTKIIRDGKIVDVDRLGGPGNPELIRFPEPIGECEAFYTGAPFDLIEQLNLSDVTDAWDKTVRWPGHCDLWKKLIDLNLTSFKPLKISFKVKPPKEGHVFDEVTYLDDGYEISPFEFLVAIGERYWRYEKGEGDACVLRVEVSGETNGKQTMYTYEMIDFYDPEDNVTAMGRTTAFPCAIVSQMLARGEFKEKGVIHVGKVGGNKDLAERILEELAKRNIRIRESVSRVL